MLEINYYSLYIDAEVSKNIINCTKRVPTFVKTNRTCYVLRIRYVFHCFPPVFTRTLQIWLNIFEIRIFRRRFILTVQHQATLTLRSIFHKILLGDTFTRDIVGSRIVEMKYRFYPRSLNSI